MNYSEHRRKRYQMPVPIGPEAIEVEFRPVETVLEDVARVNWDGLDEWEQTATLLCLSLSTWDVTDIGEDGEEYPIPLTVEGLRKAGAQQEFMSYVLAIVRERQQERIAVEDEWLRERYQSILTNYVELFSRIGQRYDVAPASGV